MINNSNNKQRSILMLLAVVMSMFAFDGYYGNYYNLLSSEVHKSLVYDAPSDNGEIIDFEENTTSLDDVVRFVPSTFALRHYNNLVPTQFKAINTKSSEVHLTNLSQFSFLLFDLDSYRDELS